MKDKKILLNNKYILKFLIFLEVEPFLKIKKIKKKNGNSCNNEDRRVFQLDKAKKCLLFRCVDQHIKNVYIQNDFRGTKC